MWYVCICIQCARRKGYKNCFTHVDYTLFLMQCRLFVDRNGGAHPTANQQQPRTQ